MERFTKEDLLLFGEYLLSSKRRYRRYKDWRITDWHTTGIGMCFHDYAAGVYNSDIEEYLKKKAPTN